jgi:hypothetical protein
VSLWAHQRREIDEHALEPGWFQLWDPRVGKTRAAVYKIAAWISVGCRRVLIVAPKGACDVWRGELLRFDPGRVCVVDLSDGPIAVRKSRIVTLEEEQLPVVAVVNRSVLKALTRIKSKDQPLRKWGPDALVLDESHEYKTPSAECSAAAFLLAQKTRFRLGLTGTPDPEDYVDFYGQFKIIAPEVFGTNLSEFEKRYVDRNPMFRSKIDGYRNVEELRQKIFSRASRVVQSDCFDMPAVRDISRTVPLPRIARELYTELVKNATADFFGIDIDATHQLSRLTILHQLAAGFVRNGDEVEWIHDAKIEAALEEIESLGTKRVVLFHRYRAEGARLHSLLKNRYGNESVRVLNGDTPGSERSATPFLTWGALRIYVAQEDTANMAISLREADHVIWTSWGPKSNVHFQARQRIFDEATCKPHGLTYTYLNAPDTVDAFMTATIARKRSASEMLLDVGFQNAALGRV